MEPTSQDAWKAYCRDELAALAPTLLRLSITLDTEQPHLAGERFLMQAVTTASGKKLILLGTETSGVRVVVKASRDPQGAHELVHERLCRQELAKLRFAYGSFLTPEERYFGTEDGFTVSVQRFIAQDLPFTKRPLTEQYFLALNALKAQESARATTYAHLSQVRHTFGYRDAQDYADCLSRFTSSILRHEQNTALASLFSSVETTFSNLQTRVEQYGGFLTHTDFVPHNFRIADGAMYLLDASSLRFGNKHEGWARFLNYLILYNRDLESALLTYLSDNRPEEERESVHAMRLYRLTELIHYYTKTLERSSGNLHSLNTARVAFWSDALAAEHERTRLSEDRIEKYRKVRDALRSDEEQARQKDLH